jgi:fucose 4-O-acetylase-like acetyltransferase
MITPQWRPDARQLRQFAWISLVGFPALGVMLWRAHGSLRLSAGLAVVGVLVWLVGLVQPNRIRPVYVALLAISLPIGWVISGVLLRLVFYGVVAPVGLLFRVAGRDALSLRRPAGPSYWRDLDSPEDAASYFRQA